MCIRDSPEECNNSYAHLAIHANKNEQAGGITNLRRTRNWVNYGSAEMPVLGTRAPIKGVLESDRYTRSLTLLLHGPSAQWEGNLCFADNHMEYVKQFHAADYHCQLQGGYVPDNIFWCDLDNCSQGQIPRGWEGDAWLGICNEATDAGSGHVLGSIMVYD